MGNLTLMEVLSNHVIQIDAWKFDTWLPESCNQSSSAHSQDLRLQTVILPNFMT